MIESDNPAGKKILYKYIKSKILPCCETGFSSLKALSGPTALPYNSSQSGVDRGTPQEV